MDEAGGVAGERAVGMAQCGIHHEMHGQAAVRDQRRVAFIAARIVTVVVNSVGVPGERRIAEVERVGERRGVAPGLVGACRGGHRGCRLLARRHGGTIDRVEIVDRQYLAMLLDRVAHGQHEDVAGTAALGDDVGDLRLLHRGLACAQLAHDLDPAACTHAARHRDRRQHDALVGMAIGADVGLANGLCEEDAEPVRWQFGAGLETFRVHVEGASGTAHGHQSDIVLDGADAPDPGAQLVHRLVHPACHVRSLDFAGGILQQKKGPQQRALPVSERSERSIRPSNTSCIRSGPADVPSCRPLPT